MPASAGQFNKPHTNVLVKRPSTGLPFLICVDQDLIYCGSDRDLARTFDSAACRQGWRVIAPGAALPTRADDAVERALAMLGCTAGQIPSTLLTRFGVSLTAKVRDRSAPPTVGREELAEQAATGLLAWQPRFPVIVGEPGSGKTNLLYKVAGLLARARPDWDMVSVDLAKVLAAAVWEGERVKLLAALLDETASCNLVVALERLELATTATPLASWMLAGALDCGARLIGACLPHFAPELEAGPLAHGIDLIKLTELICEDAHAALNRMRAALAAHHGVQIDADIVAAALDRSLSLAGSLPGKAIALLDAAAGRAALLRQPTVTLCDVYLMASRMKDM